MATILGESQLREFIKQGIVIENGDESSAEGIKYDFHLGSRFLKAGFNSPKTYEELNERDAAVVEPGEVVFVMTAERLNIPFDINIQLNVKRKLSHEGINLLGGTSVDPGYHGYLIFGIHNVAGSNFKLKPGRKLVGATFYKLSGNEIVNQPSQVPSSIEDFPDELVDLIEKYRPVNPQVINSRLNDLQSKLDTDKDAILQKMESLDNKVELLDGKVEQRFQGFETKFDTELSGLNERLLLKINNVDTKLSNVETTVSSLNKSFITLKVWGKIFTALLGVIGAIIAGILTGFFEIIFGT